MVFTTITTSLPKDVTLVTEDGKRLEAHSIILKAASTTFKSILQKSNTDKAADPNVIVYLPDFVYGQLALVLELIYLGKTKVADHLILDFKATAKSLGVFSNFKVEENIACTSLLDEGKGGREMDNFINNAKEYLKVEDGEIEDNGSKTDFKEGQMVDKTEDNYQIATNHPIIKIEMATTEKPRQQKIQRKKRKGKHTKTILFSDTKKQHNAKDTCLESQEKTCEYCGKQFKTDRQMPNYYRHMKKHKVMDEDCGCSTRFTSFIQKRWHLRVVHRGYFACDLCYQPSDYVFATEALLTNHKKDKHPENKEYDFTCSVVECNKTFKRQSSLSYHTMANHDDTSGPFCCVHCGKELANRSSLRSHEKRSHNPKRCPTCSKLVKNLRRHTMQVHTDDSDRKHQCDSCGKGFSDKQALKIHEMNVHIKARPYKCRYDCENDIGYNDLSNRNSHERKKHGGLFQDGA